MQPWRIRLLGAALLLLGLGTTARAEELKRDYFGATTPGAWAVYRVADHQGAQAIYTFTRRPDADGHAVYQVTINVSGTESTRTYTMPRDFDPARDGLSFGWRAEQRSDAAATADLLRIAEKDYRGNVGYELAERVGAVLCDRYIYGLATETAQDTGTLWLNGTIPFAIVRHKGKSLQPDGLILADFEMSLLEYGHDKTE